MLAYRNRFHSLAGLRFVYRNGQTVGSGMLKLRFSINPKSTAPKLSIVVSKKVHKSAVGRNRIRRRLFAAIRDEVTSLKPGSSVIVTVTNGGVLAADFILLKDELKRLFKQANLYK